MGPYEIHNMDCIEFMKHLPDGAVNCILTDPPYLYLKNQKLEREFDETEFFTQAKRILRTDGFIVLFGRGTSFYRWNTILADLGFTFKEEIVWDKGAPSSPLHLISRLHETISIHTKGNGIIKVVRLPYLESRVGNMAKVFTDLTQIRNALKDSDKAQKVIDIIDSGLIDFKAGYVENPGTGATCKSGTFNNVKKFEKTTKAVFTGRKEQSVMDVSVERGKNIHPTQKPVRLLERLLSLVTHPGDLVFDPFAGSCSTGVACLNTRRLFLGCEIDSEYFTGGQKRLDDYSLSIEFLKRLAE